jgi:hypothetical protein
MKVSSLFLAWFQLFDRDSVSVRVSVVPNPSNLPRDPHARLTTGDDKLVFVYLVGDINRAYRPMQVS